MHNLQLLLELNDCVYNLLCIVGQSTEQDSKEHRKLCEIEHQLVYINAAIKEKANEIHNPTNIRN